MSDRLALANAIEDAGSNGPRPSASPRSSSTRSTTTSPPRLTCRPASEAAIRGLVVGEVARLDTRIERLDAKAELLVSRIFNRLGALMAVVAGLLFAALHYWPPH